MTDRRSTRHTRHRPGRPDPGLWSAALMALVVPLGACGDGADAADRSDGDDDAPIPAVEVVQARFDALPLRERLTGTVRASGQVGIYPQSSGRITEIYVDNGDVVEEGQPLVRIESRSPQSQLTQSRANLTMAQANARSAEANLAEMESQFERTMLLAEDDLVSREEVETQRAQVESARAAHARAEAEVVAAAAAIQERAEAMDRTVVRAPIGGVVGERTAEVGMLADGQAPLFIIGGLDEMSVEVPVAQDLIGRLGRGQQAEIRTDARPGEPLRAEISRVSPFLQRGSFSAEAEIDVPNAGGRLVPGMFVTVDVFYGASDSTTVIPTSALYDHPTTGRVGTYVATPPDSGDLTTVSSDGKGSISPPTSVRFIPVQIVAEGRQTIGVTTVQPGDWVVVIGQHLLTGEGGSEMITARIRPSSWERIIGLQEMQGPELLQEVMEEHEQRSAPVDETPSASGDERASANRRGP